MTAHIATRRSPFYQRRGTFAVYARREGLCARGRRSERRRTKADRAPSPLIEADAAKAPRVQLAINARAARVHHRVVRGAEKPRPKKAADAIADRIDDGDGDAL